MVENYKTVYGVQHTVENLGVEYTKVLEETNKAAVELEKQIQYITSGAYKQEVKTAPNAVQGVTSSNFNAAPTGFNGFGGTNTGAPVNNTPTSTPTTVALTPLPTPAPASMLVSTPLPTAAAPTINNTPTSTPAPATAAPTINGFGAVPNDPPFDPDPPKDTILKQLEKAGMSVPIVKTTPTAVGDDNEEPVAPLNWGTPTPQVGSGEVNNMLTGMFGETFGG